MPNTTVDSLQIEVQATTAKAASEIDRLSESLRRLQGVTRQPGLENLTKQLQRVAKVPSMAAMEKELGRLEKQAIKDGDALLALQNKLEGLQQFKGIGTPLTIADTDFKIRETEQEIKALSAVIDSTDAKIRTLRQGMETGIGTGSSIQRLSAQLEKAAGAIPQVSMEIKKTADSCNSLSETARRAGDSLGAVSENAGQLDRAAQKVQETAQGLDNISMSAKRVGGSLEAVSEKTNDLSKAAQNVKQSAAGIENISRAAKSVDTNLDEATRSARQLGSTVERAGAQGASGLEKIITRLKSMAANFLIFGLVYRLVGSIGDSIGRMATENAKVNETLSKIVSSVQYVADALGAAIYPIIVALQPAITAILDGLAEVLNFIARIVAFFTGQDYVIQAKKTQVDFAESLDGTASSMQGVSTAAKEMKRQLLGIDELNIFDKPSSGGSGGNGGGLGDLRFEEIKNDFKLPEMIKSPVWTPNPIPAPQFEPVVLPEWATATLQAPAWSPAFVPAPVFEPFPIPELAGQKLPSPEWEPQVIQAPVFETLAVPELAGQKIPSPEWEPSLIPAPAFEALALPEWALSPLPVPEWELNPIPSPVIDLAPVQTGLASMEQAFATTWSGIQAKVGEGVATVQEKLQFARQTIADFAGTTQVAIATWGESVKANFSTVMDHIPAVTAPALQQAASTVTSYLKTTSEGVIAWAGNVKTNFSAVMEYIPTVTLPALQKSASNVISYLSSTSEGFVEWGKNVATNFQAVMGYLPGAAAEGLSAAGRSVVDWINSTSGNFATWGGNIIQTGAKAISGFVQNFVSGLSHAWDEFIGFLKATGEKISGWWSANKSWAAPVGVAALAGLSISAFVLSGGASALTSIPSMVKVAIPAMAFANGGVVRSPTLGLVGEYPGARTNPEIIAPQNVLSDVIRKETDNHNLENIILAVGERLERAIRENGDRPVNLDLAALSSATTSMQNRQNMMYGKTLQNY